MFDVHTLDEEMHAALVQQRLIAMLSSLFGGLALVLACVGRTGSSRSRWCRGPGEIGIRMALGARRGNVVWLVVREALLLVAIGIAIGVPAALAWRGWRRARSPALFGLEPTDPLDRGGRVRAGGGGGVRHVLAGTARLARRSDGGAQGGVTAAATAR